jgi:hypothetical protein
VISLSQSTKGIDVFTLKWKLRDSISELVDCWLLTHNLYIEIHSIKRVSLGYSVEGEYRCINIATRTTVEKGRFVVTVDPESYKIIEFERKEQS